MPAFSNASTTTFSSTAPLTRAAPQKDYAAAFGSLQSTYGTSGFIPAPVAKPKRQSSASSGTAPAHAKSRKVRSAPPTPAAASPSAPVPSPVQGKDYEAAFGTLSSSFGFSGHIPTMPSKSQDKSKSPSFLSKVRLSRKA